jgi:hypothetical protein
VKKRYLVPYPLPEQDENNPQGCVSVMIFLFGFSLATQ